MNTVRNGNGEVTYAVESGIAWLGFNPQRMRNCAIPILNRQMMRVLDEIEYDKTVGALVFVVEGGARATRVPPKEHVDVPASQDMAPDRLPQSNVQSWWTRLHRYQKPTIAMVQGFSVGEAYGPISACDLVFVDVDTRFVLSDIKRGFFSDTDTDTPTVAGSLIPMRQLMYRALTGESINGTVAAEWGLVNEALPAYLLRERVTDIADMLLEKNPAALSTHCA